MKAYDKGFIDGTNNAHKTQVRKYETDKAEKAYWAGYVAGIAKANLNRHIVQCNHEGRIFAVENVDDCTCPTCGRRYINKECDHLLKVLS